MQKNTRFTVLVVTTVALGGFLMGFDASVISGVIGLLFIMRILPETKGRSLEELESILIKD